MANLLEGGLAPQALPQEQGSVNLIAELQKLRPVSELPEVQAIEQQLGVFNPKNIQLQTGLLFSMNPESQKDIIKSALPDAKFSKREGADIIEFQGREFVLNAPGLSAQDVQSGIAQFLSFLPAAKAASFGKNLLQKIGIGAATAGATETGLQLGAEALGGEQGVIGEDVATAVALGGAGEVIAPLVKPIVKPIGEAVKGALGKLRPAEEFAEAATAGGQAALEAQEQLAKATATEAAIGKELLPAQRTAGVAELEIQSFLGQLPKTARTAEKELRKLNAQASEGVNEFLAKIAPSEAVETAGQAAVKAADTAIDMRRAARAEAASPLFNAAFDQTAIVSLPKTKDLIGELKSSFIPSSQAFKALSKFEKDIDLTGGNLQRIHSAKEVIDNRLSALSKNFGKTSDVNKAVRAIAQAKSSLIDEISEQSPLYKEALEEFALLSPTVNELTEGLIGNISKLDPEGVSSITAKIFSPEVNTSIIKNAKKVISEVDPNAWNQIVRAEAEKRLGKSRVLIDSIESGAVENVPNQLRRALFGNAKQRENLMSSLDGPLKRNALALEDWLRRASLGRPGGSQTAVRGEIKERLQRGVFKALQDLFSPRATISKAGAENVFDTNSKALAEVFFNPKFTPELSKITRKSPTSSAAGKALLQLFNDAGASTEEGNP